MKLVLVVLAIVFLVDVRLSKTTAASSLAITAAVSVLAFGFNGLCSLFFNLSAASFDISGVTTSFVWFGDVCVL